MKKEIMELWVSALESGNYLQGEGCLRNGANAFCCLGVLCNIHARMHPKIAAKETDPMLYLGNDSYLPEEVVRWAGMNSYSGMLPSANTRTAAATLARMNDRGIAFPIIAQTIRKYYKDL